MSGRPLNRDERALVEAVPAALRGGLELFAWWRRTNPSRDFETLFQEAFVPNRPDDTSYGFFSTADLPSGPLRVNGNVQRMFYDEPKAPEGTRALAAELIDEQVREFVLHYFMRISDYAQPEALGESQLPAPPGFGIFSQCPGGEPVLGGFGFVQEIFKRADDGRVGLFEDAERFKIVDLRRVGPEFEWIVLRNPIFNFSFQFKPFGNDGPQLVLPIQQFNYLILAPEFVIDQHRPEPGILGRYGFGYAFVNKPQVNALAYGPGDLQPAFQILVWDVHESGRVTVQAAFVSFEPTAMLDLTLDPLTWGFQLLDVFGTPGIRAFLAPYRRFYNSLPTSRLRFDPVFPTINLLNLLTLQQADKRLCISVDQLRMEFLYIHFLQHYQTILGSLQTWRQVPDWLDRAALPRFVVTGRS